MALKQLKNNKALVGDVGITRELLEADGKPILRVF